MENKRYEATVRAAIYGLLISLFVTVVFVEENVEQKNKQRIDATAVARFGRTGTGN